MPGTSKGRRESGLDAQQKEKRNFLVAQVAYLCLAIAFAVGAASTDGAVRTVLLVPAWLFGIISTWSLLFVGGLLSTFLFAQFWTRHRVLGSATVALVFGAGTAAGWWWFTEGNLFVALTSGLAVTFASGVSSYGGWDAGRHRPAGRRRRNA